MTSDNLLSLPTSFQANSWSGISDQVQVGQSLEMIRSGAYATLVNRLRGYLDKGDRDTYDQEKRRLPAVTFSANFKQKRNRSSISQYNQLLVLDIDKLKEEQMVSLKANFSSDPYIFAFWESPSKAGIKGLIHFDFGNDFPAEDVNFRHSYGFRKVYAYLLGKYGIEIDTSGSDVTRLCFFSYDPLLKVKTEFESFPVTYNESEAIVIREAVRSAHYTYAAEPTQNQKFNPAGKNKQLDRSAVQAIIRHLNKRGLSITDSFNNWYQIGYAIANTFTYELGVKYFFALSKMDGKKFNEQGCRDMINYCFANSMGKFSFATVVYFAKQVGYREKREVPKVEVIL
ncbi:MAG: BT4734/BF3469 family protein [Sphingobacteriaceae bacterium]